MEYSDIKDLIATVVDTDIMAFELNYKDIDIKIDRNKYTTKFVNGNINGNGVETLGDNSLENSVDSNVAKTGKAIHEKPEFDLDRIAINTSKKPTKEGNAVTSPIVGTFYSSNSPTTSPFVEVGTKVKKGDVLFIVEAMKVINEIVSDYDGEVLEILAKDGELIEFAQPIVIIG